MMSSDTTTDDRAGVRVLRRLHPEWSERRIGREIGRTPKFVKKWIERDDTANLARGRSKKRYILTEEFRKKIKRKMVGSLRAKGGGKRRKLSIREMVKELKENGEKGNYTTVREAVNDISKYRRRKKRVRLTEDFAQRRFAFADSHLSWSAAKWRTLFNTDSSPFYLQFKYNRQNDGFWCEEGVDPPGVDTDKYAIKTELYMGVCAQGVSKPVFIDHPARVNATNYSEIVLPHFRRQLFERKENTDDPSTTNLFADDYVFQQDLATSHWAKLSTTYLDEFIPSYIKKVDTPPRFFEWPVEQFFNMLEARVYKKGKADNLNQLKKWIVKDLKDPFWFEWCAKTFATMHQRCVDVCEQEGWHTSH